MRFSDRFAVSYSFSYSYNSNDYGWVTTGDTARSARGLATVSARLGYPSAAQDYLAGFVLTPEDAGQWAAIDAAADTIERTMEIPEPLISLLHEARLFRMLLPRSVGGDQVEHRFIKPERKGLLDRLLGRTA